MATWRSNSSSSASAILASCMMPALLTRTSTPPKAVSAASNMRRTASASETSALAVSALPPLSLDLASQFLGGGFTAGIVDDNGETVAGKALGDGGTNATRCTGYDGNF